MNEKYYCLPGLVIRALADDAIEDNANFLAFTGKCDCADLTVEIKRRDTLPVPCGECLFKNSHCSCYVSDGISRYYAYYFANEQQGYLPYSCFERDGNGNRVYISFGGKLWDKMIFDTLNIPDLLTERGSIIIHASLIEVRGEGIVFIGHKGAGKSTQASLWKKYGDALIINGDRAVVNNKDGVYYAGGSPICGSSAIALNRNVPLKAIVVLEKGDVNTVSLLPPRIAFPSVIEKVTYSHGIGKITESAVDTVLSVLQSVPVYRLTNTAEEDSVRVLEKVLWK